jgi:hypothetical protein
MSSSSGGRIAPRHAVLLRWGGVLSVLDLSRGAEVTLADEVRPAGTCAARWCCFNPVAVTHCMTTMPQVVGYVRTDVLFVLPGQPLLRLMQQTHASIMACAWCRQLIWLHGQCAAAAG